MRERLDQSTATYSALIKTIRKIESLPLLRSPKWREGMLRHYYNEFAELLCYAWGLDNPNKKELDYAHEIATHYVRIEPNDCIFIECEVHINESLH